MVDIGLILDIGAIVTVLIGITVFVRGMFEYIRKEKRDKLERVLGNIINF